MQRPDHERAVRKAGLDKYLPAPFFGAFAEVCGRKFAALAPWVDSAYSGAFNAAHDRAERLAALGQYLTPEQIGDEVTHEYHLRVPPEMRWPECRGWPKTPHPSWS